jgi:hypothetical protein
MSEQPGRTGQRTSRANRAPVAGSVPWVLESP